MNSALYLLALLSSAMAGGLSSGSYLSSGSGGHFGSGGGGGGAQAVISNTLAHLSSSGFLSGSQHFGGPGPIIGGTAGHGPVVSGHSGVNHYKLNLPVNNPGLTYSVNRPVQILRPATLRVVARPVSVNVVKSVAVEEHPRPIQATVHVTKPATVTVAKPVTLNIGGHSGGGFNFGGHSDSALNLAGYSGGAPNLGGHSGGFGDFGGHAGSPWTAQDAATLGW